MFRRVTIIGLGLIGGSLALAIKRQKIAKEVIGVSRRRSTVRSALSRGMLDRASVEAIRGVKRSDLVILATPVVKIIDIMKDIAGVIQKGAIVIDVGSTKRDIVDSIESVLPEGVSFVGSHPLAGSEKSGLIYANRELFKGAYCVLTKTRRTNLDALKKIERFWKRIGMKVKIMSPEKHDKIVSKLSHLPHAMAVALSNACDKGKLELAAGGFKDATRIASSSPELWRDIFITNRKNIIKDISIVKEELSKIASVLEERDIAGLLRLFKKAKSIRDSVL